MLFRKIVSNLEINPDNQFGIQIRQSILDPISILELGLDPEFSTRDSTFELGPESHRHLN